MKTIKAMSRLYGLILFGALAAAASAVSGQTTLPLAWEQTKYFQYNIEKVVVKPATTAGKWNVKVIFSVYNPVQQDYWELAKAEPFTKGGTVTLDVAWNPRTDFTNTGSTGAELQPVVPIAGALGTGAAMPVQVRNLTKAKLCATVTECPNVEGVPGRFVYFVDTDVTPVPATAPLPGTAITGRVALEGRPVCAGTQLVGCPVPTAAAPTTYANIPVTSSTADFALTSSTYAKLTTNQRRPIVDINKCKGCHDNKKVGDVFVPRLSLHGANRNENLDLCVACHNPNQTDVPYRYSEPADPRIGAAETPIDFKVMVHSIHAGGFRKTPYVVIGFRSSVNDFSGVRFPAELRKSCLKCHIEANGKGSFELPLNSTVLGTTIKTQSVYQVAAGAPRSIDVNPDNDTKISPTAATCSACHDNSEARSHMIRTGGASFATRQDQIGTTVKERCEACHGRGKEKDVRKVHELSSSSSRD